MKESFKKFLSYISLLAFALIVYKEVIAPISRTNNGSLKGTDISLNESVKMFEKFGGEKGEVPVTLFVTSWCGVCKALEETLQNAGVKFVKADIENNRDAYLYYQRAVKGQTNGVPVTVVGQDVFLGLDTRNIGRAIKALRVAPKKA